MGFLICCCLFRVDALWTGLRWHGLLFAFTLPAGGFDDCWLIVCVCQFWCLIWVFVSWCAQFSELRWLVACDLVYLCLLGVSYVQLCLGCVVGCFCGLVRLWFVSGLWLFSLRIRCRCLN